MNNNKFPKTGLLKQKIDDSKFRNLYIGRISDTFINKNELQQSDKTIEKIANFLQAGAYFLREFITFMGQYLQKYSEKKSCLSNLRIITIRRYFVRHSPIQTPV